VITVHNRFSHDFVLQIDLARGKVGELTSACCGPDLGLSIGIPIMPGLSDALLWR
jgi:hypothetical protein